MNKIKFFILKKLIGETPIIANLQINGYNSEIIKQDDGNINVINCHLYHMTIPPKYTIQRKIKHL